MVRQEIDRSSPMALGGRASPWEWAGRFVREWAEVAYIQPKCRSGAGTLSLPGHRIRSPQGVLFSVGTGVKLFAVVTSDWEMGRRKLLEWQKFAGRSVNAPHQVLKDELAAGVYQAEFGALRPGWLQVVTSSLWCCPRRRRWMRSIRNSAKEATLPLQPQAGHHARQMLMQVRGCWKDRGPGLSRLRTAAWRPPK